MAYKGFTETHRRGNERYLAKHLTKSIRIPKSEWQAVQAHLQARGYVSFAGYVMDLIRQDMGSEDNTGPQKGRSE